MIKEIPNRIFVTGAPGCKWTSVTHLLETADWANLSDRTSDRHYDHHVFQGHHGVYYGLPHRKYEFNCTMDGKYLDSAYESDAPGKFMKAHDWGYMLDDISEKFSGDWIIMVMRNDIDCFSWWNQHGGYVTKYPSYDTYSPDAVMMSEIMQLNDRYSRFAQKHDLQWNYFTPRWVEEHFGKTITDKEMSILNNKNMLEFNQYFNKVMVSIVKL
jgi:hypothetical protein